MANIIGKVFSLITFGESHGETIGGVLDGCPAGLIMDVEFIQEEIQKRKPLYIGSTPRKEADIVKFLSGIFKGKTTGTPIAFIVKNSNFHSHTYEELKDVYRPSHADYTYDKKYANRDYRGGGRTSARETLARVIGGAIAKLLLKQIGIEIYAYASQIGNIFLKKSYKEIDLSKIESFNFRFPDKTKTNELSEYIKKIKNEGDSIGGCISTVVKNCPIGLGEPVFDKLQADLAKAMLSINAAKGFEYGEGFKSSKMKGSENNDEFFADSTKTVTLKTNHAGGILGGISNGEDIFFKTAFKPPASIAKKQKSVNKNGENINIQIKGNHDTLIIPRAVVIVEAMTALTIADHFLRNKISKI